ncbi:hypothetical protein STEG23_001426 [Scotinomys teguina]
MGAPEKQKALLTIESHLQPSYTLFRSIGRRQNDCNYTDESNSSSESCISVYHMHAVSMEARRGHLIPGTGVTQGCKSCNITILVIQMKTILSPHLFPRERERVNTLSFDGESKVPTDGHTVTLPATKAAWHLTQSSQERHPSSSDGNKRRDKQSNIVVTEFNLEVSINSLCSEPGNPTEEEMGRMEESKVIEDTRRTQPSESRQQIKSEYLIVHREDKTREREELVELEEASEKYSVMEGRGKRRKEKKM